VPLSQNTLRQKAQLFEETKMAFGPLDILVNNAVFQQYLPIEQASLKLFGDKGGNIINISSGASKYPLPGASLYSAERSLQIAHY
jgi:3-oxoacyl-[acyl-carrier protein] reductase